MDKKSEIISIFESLTSDEISAIEIALLNYEQKNEFKNASYDAYFKISKINNLLAEIDIEKKNKEIT